MNLFQVLGGLTRDEEDAIREEAAASFPDTLMTRYGGIDTIYDDQGRRRDFHGMPENKYSVEELQKAIDVNASRSQIREGIFDKVLSETGNLSMATDAAQAADFAPFVGTAIGVEEGEIARQEIMPYIDEGKYGDAAIEGAKTLLGYGQAAVSAAPVVGGAVRTANRVMPEVMADAVGLGRAIYNRDLEGIGEVFTRSRPPQSLGAAGIGDNGGPRMPREYEVDGEALFQYLSNIPSAKEIATGEATIPMEGVTNVKSMKPNALRDFQSYRRETGELVPPQRLTSIAPLEGRTILSIVGDQSGRHDTLSVGDAMFDDPVRSFAGFEYSDIIGQGYAGADSATRSKLAEAMVRENPIMMSVMMGDRSSDFAMHTGMTFAAMLKHAKVASKDVDAVNEAIRSIGKPKVIPKTDADGNILKKKDGTNQTRTITEYPYTDAPSVADPEAFARYVQYLPSGGHRAYLMKGMDKAKLAQKGMPTAADARLAVADIKQLGMDFGTTGYRFFEPDLQKGQLLTSPEQSTTYAHGYDKVGPSMTLMGDDFRGVPASLMFSDLGTAMRSKPDPKGDGGLVLTPPMYKVLESSPTRAAQKIQPMNVEMVDSMMEIERKFGRRASLSYARDILKNVKITGKIIDAARKKNAPTWMIAAMTTQQAMQGEE